MGRRESLPDLHHVAAADPNLPGNQNPLERHAHLFLRAWRAQLRGLWRGMLRQSTHDKAKSGKARAAGKLLRETAGRIFLHKCLHKCSTNIHIYDINLKGNPSYLRIRSCPRTDTPHQKTDMSAISPRGRSTTDWGNAYDCPMLTAAGPFRCGGPGPAARRPFPIHAHTTEAYRKGEPSCANPCRHC